MVVGYAPGLLKKWLAVERRFKSEIFFSMSKTKKGQNKSHDLVVKYAVT